jgi:hypothetical protein
VSRTPRSRQPCPHFARAIGFLLRGGDVWPEILVPIVSGRAGQPITFGTYRRGRCADHLWRPDLTAGPWTNLEGNWWSVRTQGKSGGEAPALSSSPFQTGSTIWHFFEMPKTGCSSQATAVDGDGDAGKTLGTGR